jgi:hemoglobin/transferrin/lactoferrin receptor protein
VPEYGTTMISINANQQPERVARAMHRKSRVLVISISLLFGCTLAVRTQTLVGTTRDSATGRPLPGANVLLPALQRGTTCDGEGRFRFERLQPGAWEVAVTHVGYRAAIRTVTVPEHGSVTADIALEASAVELGDVVVTSMRAMDLQRDLPVPLEVATDRDVARTPAFALADVLDQAPGVSLVRDGLWGATVSLRGMSRNNMVTLVDGSRVETATNHAAGLSMIDMNDVERVEVLKGAQSSLYGSGATGGVINIITRPGGYGAGSPFSATFTSGYASVNEGATGSLALDGGGSWWTLHAAGAMRSAVDARTPDGVMQDSRYHDHSVSVTGGVRPAEGHELTVRVQSFRAEDVGIPGGKPFPTGATARYPFEQRDMESVRYALSELAGGLPSVSVNVYRQMVRRDVELTQPGVVVHPSADHLTWGGTGQAVWTPLTEHRITAGIDAWQRQYDGIRTKTLAAKNTVVTDLPTPESSFRSMGLFAQDDILFLDGRLRTSVGARADAVHVRNAEALDPVSITVNGVTNTTPPNQRVLWPAGESDAASWALNAAALYAVLPGVDVTASAARAFRAPTLEERFQNIQLGGATYLGDPALAPESGTYLDAGLRLRAGRLALSAGVFLNLMRNLVTDVLTAPNSYVKQNIGRAQLAGGDLGAEWNAIGGTVLYGSLSFVRGRDTENGTDLPEIPALGGRGGVRVPLWSLATLDAGMLYAASQEHVAVGESATPGYGVLNISVATRALVLDRLSARVYAGVDNALDHAYRNHLSTYRGIGVTEPGRNIWARLSLTAF